MHHTAHITKVAFITSLKLVCVEHIVNSCLHVSQCCRNDGVNVPAVDVHVDTVETVAVEDVFSPERDSVEAVVSRVKIFVKLSEEREKEVAPVNLGDV